MATAGGDKGVAEGEVESETGVGVLKTASETDLRVGTDAQIARVAGHVIHQGAGRVIPGIVRPVVVVFIADKGDYEWRALRNKGFKMERKGAGADDGELRERTVKCM